MPSDQSEALLQRPDTVPRHHDIGRAIATQSEEKAPAEVCVKLADPREVHERATMDAEEFAGIEAALELGNGDVQDVLALRRHRVGRTLARDDVRDLVHRDQLDPLAYP